MPHSGNEKIPHLAAVTFALPDESRDFVAKLRGARQIRRGSLPVFVGALGEKQIAVCHTGVGAESCRERITDFLKNHQPKYLISSGFAGGLDPVLKVGDLVLAENFTDPTLLAKAHLQNVRVGKLTTQPAVAETVTDKAALASQTGAFAVDMETATISELCALHGVPMLSLRGISDSAADDLPVSFSIWFDEKKQKPRVGALLWELATHPKNISPFAKFVRGIPPTRKRMTTALCELLGGM